LAGVAFTPKATKLNTSRMTVKINPFLSITSPLIARKNARFVRDWDWVSQDGPAWGHKNLVYHATSLGLIK
jgi:hypothetical protein